MRSAGIATLALSLVILLAQISIAVPPKPEVVERWGSEGRLQELAAIEQRARDNGFNDMTGVPGDRNGRALTGTGPVIVILVDFDDNVADVVAHPVAHFDDMMFSVGTHPTGSMRDYYLENSYNQFDFAGYVVGWYRMPELYSYYTNGNYGFGSYPRCAKKMVEHAIAAADPDVDFSLYDSDGPDGIPNSGDDDGYVDALFVVHAGSEGAGGDGWAIWSHAGYTRAPVNVDGVQAFRYATTPEDDNIGVYCHELGHVYGLPDFYDTDYSSEGLDAWCLMASGSHLNGGRTPCHFNAYCKLDLGWVDPVVPTSNQTSVVFPGVETNPVVYKLWTDGSPSNEYFLVEYRKRQYFDTYIPWKGLCVYHVDENMTTNRNECCGPGSPHYLVALEQADGDCDLENGLAADGCDPFPSYAALCDTQYTVFDANSWPNSNAYDDSETLVAIRNIVLGGGVVTCDIEVTSMTDVGAQEDLCYVCSPLQLSNPFEPGTAIQFLVSHPEGLGGIVPVRVGIYDVRGRHVRTLAEGDFAPGLREVSWDGLDSDLNPVASGVYFVTLRSGSERTVTKLLLAR
jgi:immune inhibitor A